MAKRGTHNASKTTRSTCKRTPLVRVGSQDLQLQIQLPPRSPLDDIQFRELWNDVRAASSSKVDEAEDSQEAPTNPNGVAKHERKWKVKTRDRDPDFTPTSVEDLYFCAPQDSQSDIKSLDREVPRKIVDNTRDRFQDCVRLGHMDEGCKVLDDALKKLGVTLNGVTHVDRTPWELGIAEILIDQGRKKEARDVLSKCLGQSRGESSVLTERHHKRRRTGADTNYEEMRKMAQDVESELDISRRAEDWDKARELGEQLFEIHPSYFNININEPMERFNNVRRFLHLGLLKEIQADQIHDVERKHGLFRDALEIYNHGCYTTELYHEFFDSNEARVYGFDHSDCANLFFSAARICYHFQKNGYMDKNGHPIQPKQFDCKGPPLIAQDWGHQALDFLEQGRSRALLDSIIRGGAVADIPRRLIRQTVHNDMATVVDVAVRVIKKRDSMVATPKTSRAQSRSGSGGHPEILLESTTSTVKDLSDSAHIARGHLTSTPPKQIHENDRQSLTLQTSNLEGSAISSPASSPVDASTPLQTREGLLANMKVLMRWYRALLYALAQINPTLDATLEAAALPSHGKLAGIEEMRASIPSDTVVIEYALASTSPSGVMTIVVTSDGVQAVEWTKIEVTNVRNCIAALRDSMSSSDMRMRESKPVVPGSQASTPIVRPPGPERKASAIHQEQLDAILRNTVVTPVKPHLEGKRKLIIVPSGDLAHVPWTIFFDLPITVVPSLNIWTRLQAQANAAVLSNPKTSIVSTASEDKEKAKAGFPSLRDIPFSRIEALYIARLHQQSPFIADDKDRKAFEAFAKGTQILHICAHGTFDDEAPMSSSIQLLKEPLTMLDWHKLSIKADLVVFSSCLSGISKAYDSVSTIGFAHTLLGTGTKAFIGSLWDVDDAATLLLMTMFYDELRKPLPPADALFEAQKRMRTLTKEDLEDVISEVQARIEITAHESVLTPKYYMDVLRKRTAEEFTEERYWAAFVLVGYGSRVLYSGNEQEK